MKPVFVAVGLVGVVVAASCAPIDDDEPSEERSSNLFTPKGTVLWDQHVVNACIVPGTGSPNADFQEAKKQVIIALQNSWERAANITFDFRCRPTKNRAIITLEPTKDLGGGGNAVIIGMNACNQTLCEPNPPRMHFCAPSLQGADCTQQQGHKVDKNEHLRKLAIHELGHTLGFGHEHRRQDPGTFCKADDKGAETNGDVRGTSYDPDSVMQYCRDVDGNKRTDEMWEIVADRLSESDKLGMRNTYGAPVQKAFWSETLYKSSDSATVYLLRDGVACAVTWPQYVDIGKPLITNITAAQGQQLRTKWNGQFCTKTAIGALPDDLYRPQGQATVYRLTGQTACAVTWDQFVRLGQPSFQVPTVADSQRFQEAYSTSTAAFCTDKQAGL